MISTLDIRNFKSLKSTTLHLKNLNLLTGINGMGKSSVIQSLLLLRQSRLQDTLSATGLALKGNLVEIGTGKDALYQGANKDETIHLEIQYQSGENYGWDFSYVPDTDFLPLATSVGNLGTLHEKSLFNRNFQYLNAEHIIPQNTYKKSELEVVQNGQLGKYGEYAVHYLSIFGFSEKVLYENLKHPKAKSDSLIHQVDAWLSELSPGTKLVVEDLKGLDLVRLGFQFETKVGYTDEFKPINVGFGLTYVLPVIVSLLTARIGKLLIIENPESHLHPKGQAIVGRLAALTAENGIQVILESHSDHILNSVRVAVKDGAIHRDNAAIFYFVRDEKGDGHRSKDIPVNINEDGELSEYPSDFLDEWNNQLLRLM